MVTSLTPVRRAIWACVNGTPSSSEARYRAPAAIPTGEFASRTFESFTWATRANDRSPTRGSRPNREERLESWARPGAKARSVRSYRVHWLTRRRRFNAATLRASIGFPFASRRPLPTIDPSPLSGAITDGGGPARIRSSPSNVVQSGPWSTRLSSTTKPQLSHTRSPRTGSTYRAKLPQFGQRAGSEPEGSDCSSRLNLTSLAFVDVNWLIALPREELNS